MLDEFLVVFVYSKRAQLALIVGAARFFSLMVGGVYYVNHMDLGDVPTPFAEAVRDALVPRYDKAAWIALIGSIVTAVRCYRKNRERLLRHW